MERNDHMTPEVCERIYQNTLLLIEGRLYSEAADEFARIPDYKDAAERMRECTAMKDVKRLDEIYAEADKAAKNMNVRSQEKAIRIFQRIPGHRDADERIELARRTIEEIIVKERKDREEAIRAAEQREQKRKIRKKRITRIAVAAALAAVICAVGVFLFRKYGVPALQYQRGVKEMEAGAYDDAYRTLHGLNYRDSSDLIFRIGKERLKDAEVGSVVLFGEYMQGSIKSEEKTPIEWQVLDRDGSKVMLISKYALDALPYMKYSFDEEHTPITWRTCLLREWLNGFFLETAFDPGEIRMLQRTRLSHPDGSFDTTDRVYLLSVQEAETYFASDDARKCTATQYASEYGAYRSSIEHTSLWWLRTPVYSESDAALLDGESYVTYRIACVGTSGQIIDIGHGILNRGYGVRPVIWVDTDPSQTLTFRK